jgi:hypothetical protein
LTVPDRSARTVRSPEKKRHALCIPAAKRVRESVRELRGPTVSTQLPFPSYSQNLDGGSFPTRGVSGGWRDPWDVDPYDSVLSTLRQRNDLRRQVSEANVQIELLAQARADGRWEAHVISPKAAPAPWPSVNGPTAAVALDALEAELRELMRCTSVPGMSGQA